MNYIEMYKFLKRNQEKYDFPEKIDGENASEFPMIEVINYWLETECIYLKTFLFADGIFQIDSGYNATFLKELGNYGSVMVLTASVFDIGYDQYFLCIRDRRGSKSYWSPEYYIVQKYKRWEGIK